MINLTTSDMKTIELEDFTQQTVLAEIVLFQRLLTACLREEILYYIGLSYRLF